jgi:hypothetical protein
MAGGMSGKRGDYGPMSERVARGNDSFGRPEPPGRPPMPEVKHCWVGGRDGRHPGLLAEWRQRDGTWEGRVVHPAYDETNGWILVEEWLPAGLLDPA